MNNFPDEFPIRYAIIADNRRQHEAIKHSHDEVLFKQLIKYLQKVNLSKKDLRMTYAYTIVQQFEKNYESIVKLGAGLEEQKKLSEALKEFDPEIRDKSGVFIAYDLALISYKQRDEIPLFWYINQHKGEKEVLKKIGYDPVRTTATHACNIYSKLLNKEIDGADIWQIRSVDRPSFGITMTYSDLWKELDEKSKEDYNAISISFYDRKEYSSGSYALAQAEYAPNGDWAAAGTVKTGDYSKHEMNYKFRPQVSDPEKYADKRPTDEESKLCEAFSAISEADNYVSDEATRMQKTADQEAVSKDVVDAAVLKCFGWVNLYQ